MAQLKSGSTVGGTAIADTSQTGIDTSVNAIGTTRYAYPRNNSTFSYNYHTNFAGTSIGFQNGIALAMGASGYGPNPGTFPVIGVGTWRAYGGMFRNIQPGQDSPGNYNMAGSGMVRTA